MLRISNTQELGEREVVYGVTENIKWFTTLILNRKSLDFEYEYTMHVMVGAKDTFSTRKSSGACELMKLQEGNQI